MVQALKLTVNVRRTVLSLACILDMYAARDARPTVQHLLDAEPSVANDAITLLSSIYS